MQQAGSGIKVSLSTARKFLQFYAKLCTTTTKYTFPFLQSLLRVKNIASDKKLQRLLGSTSGGQPDNGPESTSVRASSTTVDHSRSTMC